MHRECGKNVDAPGLVETVGDRLRQSRKVRDHRQASCPWGCSGRCPLVGSLLVVMPVQRSIFETVSSCWIPGRLLTRVRDRVEAEFAC